LPAQNNSAVQQTSILQEDQILPKHKCIA
jgi:hypothetical protein